MDLFKPKIESMSRRARRAIMRDMASRRYAVNDVLLAGNLSANTLRGRSGAVWSSCPSNEFRADPSKGQILEEDFLLAGNATMSSALAGSVGRWSMYGYAGAQVNDAQKEGGVITLSSDGDQEGLALLSSAGSYRFVTTSSLALNQKMWFEAKVSRSDIATAKGEFFVGCMKPTLSSGLPAAAQPITVTDDTLMTAGDLFGFHCCSSTGVRGGMTEVAVAFCLASGTVNYPTNLTTLLASTGQSVLAANAFVRLGWIFDPDAPVRRVTAATARQTVGTMRKALIRFYVNGLEHPTFLTYEDVQNATATQAFPTAFMSPCIAHMNTTGSSPATTSIDFLDIAQRASGS